MSKTYSAYVRVQVPEGYELAYPDLRVPTRGESIANQSTMDAFYVQDDACYSNMNSDYRVIVRRAPPNAPRKAYVEFDLPPGYELAEPRMRPPKAGENYLTVGNENCEVGRSLGDWGSSRQHHRVIVRPVWKWPEWLTAAAIAMDANGEWRAFDSEPRMAEHRWYIPSSVGYYLKPAFFRFDPPPCDDWTKSLRLNPNLNR